MHFLGSLTAILPFLATTPLLLQLVSAAEAGQLQIETLAKPESCTRKTVTGDTIDVHYRGTLADTGVEFDASYNRGQPLTFTVGMGRVIKGWEDGLLDMCVGEKRKLTIPPEMGYGDRAMGPIPAGSTLVFETELVNIQGSRDEL